MDWMWNNREKDDTKIFGLCNTEDGITLTMEGCVFGVEGQQFSCGHAKFATLGEPLLSSFYESNITMIPKPNKNTLRK